MNTKRDLAETQREAVEIVLEELRSRPDLDLRGFMQALAHALENAAVVEHDPASPVVKRWSIDNE